MMSYRTLKLKWARNHECYCGDCGEQCIGEMRDFGIGPGEAWGKKFNHVDNHFVSDCCEATVFEDPELEWEAEPMVEDDGY